MSSELLNYRDYENANEVVKQQYHLKNKTTSYNYNRTVRNENIQVGRWELDIMDAFKLMDNIIDTTDPDNDSPQIYHFIQTGEACRSMYPDLDWFHLVGFIHDLGKIMALESMHNLPIWLAAGDIYPLGCKFSTKIPFAEFFAENEDYNVYTTDLGIYTENLGFDNTEFCFGHDEYLFQLLLQNKCQLPDEALYIIRYHSFYSWHRDLEYQNLASEKDWNMLKFLQSFSKCDLYSKEEFSASDLMQKLPYYEKLIDKYFPSRILKF